MPAKKIWLPVLASNFQQYLFALGVVAATGLVNLGLMKIAGPRVPGFFFLLVVVLLALKVDRGPVLLSGAVSALAWNYFFLPPRFTFYITTVEDAILFALYFIIASVLRKSAPPTIAAPPTAAAGAYRTSLRWISFTSEVGRPPPNSHRCAN